MPRYTVHNIPFLLKPFLLLYGWIGNIGFFLQSFVFRSLVRMEYHNIEHVNNTPNYIFALWHENVSLYFFSHPKFNRPNIWLSYPFWFMKPVHLMKKRIGIQEIAYGASGHDGKKAMGQVISRLKEGWSTFLNPDGPQGPLNQMKDGVLIMSLKTGTPIIPIGFEVEGNWRLPTWDNKRYPPFFSTLKVVYGSPIYVTEENFNKVKILVTEGMNDKLITHKGKTILPNI